jgi:hypothetical protein
VIGAGPILTLIVAGPLLYALPYESEYMPRRVTPKDHGLVWISRDAENTWAEVTR